MEIKYFTYHKTRCFFVKATNGRLLAFDAGWPCTLFEYQREMKKIGLRFDDIDVSIVSHVHMDHAGLLGEFQAQGIDCMMTPEQFSNIAAMEQIITRNALYKNYVSIKTDHVRVLQIPQYNERLETLGVGGQVFSTPGHSIDSLSFLSSNGEALIGDLSPIDQIMPSDTISNESYYALIENGAKTFFPSHAELFTL